MNLPAKLDWRNKQLAEVTTYIGEVDETIKVLAEEIVSSISEVEENKDENKEMYKKM